jgi:hypothetical protein
MELGDSDTRSLLSPDAGSSAPNRRRSTDSSITSSNATTASYTLMDTPVATAVLEPFQLQSHAVTMADSSIVYATPVLSFCKHDNASQRKLVHVYNPCGVDLHASQNVCTNSIRSYRVMQHHRQRTSR